ncbi:MAG: DUF4317 domain-containing protein [Clostridiales Family XIII bacterium]|uniref:DUF4317 domain-containing protein n=1 Tax=Hominibacterium faecale TaxID=2839743 RepID=UPI0011DD22FB|nr:DUF4317 domain-containing protein [Hominibacterium faecale]MCC2865228.1 DUF4317 domain-containing protein [Anaerovorax odorimutans]MCI7300315.1 DUF4317 domain-containing protein [Clostridia bacterium]MDE8732764.1 DUF4317 domain-containing protein [Eubacteriales bacterium DFI.9.88]MDY3011587.1 DUF4317 domain-containing protein [Clostridiales Family XIII bacterium]
MINKEILEIKKQFTPENCTITRMCGCYVDAEKVRKYEVNRSFLSLPEEEAFKYFEIFKQTLTGTLGKKLINMEFPLAQEEPGGTQEFLFRLRNSKLEDESLVDEFFNKIIDHYEYGENYYIILIHAVYDVPGRAEDGLEMFDASENIYEYILCSICPVKLSKAGLSYDADQNSIVGRSRDWVVDPPAKGFLFPAFNDRTGDIHQALYFSKKPEELQPKLIEELLGSEIPLSAENQKVTFNEILSETLGEECDFTMVRCIHDNLQEMIEESKEEPEPLELDKFDMRRLLERSGASEDKLEKVETTFEQTAGERRKLMASNIAETKKFSIETPDVVIKVSPDRADLVETKVIDGRRCIVIGINDHVEVNGVDIDIKEEEEV